VAVLSWRFGGRLQAWTVQRLSLTHRLVEGMVGHRTRLAQERPQRRDAEEDRALLGYVQASQRLDAAVVPIVALAPGGWILLGLLGLAPALLNGPVSATALAISLGGVLFAHRALGGLAGGLGLLSRAKVAWGQVAPLFKAGAQAAPVAPFLPCLGNFAGSTAHPAAGDHARQGPLLDASGVSFSYRAQGEPVLRDVNLRIAPGERVLLQGPSGGGKSTLAALMVGLRQPGAGLLLLGGLDRATLGEQWHRLATEAPQFHDNHVMTGTLAFNLLMGRGWPATEADVAEAKALCEELGLGELLARMPAGLQQRVGETGWQLSHGEKSRLFLARALLQRTPLTVLDESFAALDPPTLRRCLECALRRTDALVVIAHP
jgi:ATP-binding cassette, subfamily B, bacterial